MEVIQGAGHYYKDQPDKLREAVAAITSWLAQRGFIDQLNYNK